MSTSQWDCNEGCSAAGTVNNNLYFAESIPLTALSSVQYTLSSAGEQIKLQKQLSQSSYFRLGYSHNSAVYESDWSTDGLDYQPSLSFNSDVFAHTLDSEVENYLTMELVDTNNHLKLSMCSDALGACGSLQYQFTDSFSNNFQIGFMRKLNANFDRADGLGIELNGVLGYGDKREQLESFSVGYEWSLMRNLEMAHEFNQMNYQLSSLNADSLIFSGGEFTVAQYKTELSWTSARQSVQLELVDQSDASGGLHYNLPVWRTGEGQIVFDDFMIQFAPQVSRYLSLKYQWKSNISSNISSYILPGLSFNLVMQRQDNQTGNENIFGLQLSQAF